MYANKCKAGDRLPAMNIEFWRDKIAKNVERNQMTIRNLRKLGWRVLVLWECEIRNPRVLEGKV